MQCQLSFSSSFTKIQTQEPQQFTKEAKGSFPQQAECLRMQPTAMEHLLMLVDAFFLPTKTTPEHLKDAMNTEFLNN